jgi:uncharacterized protein
VRSVAELGESMIDQYLVNDRLKILVKVNAPKTEILEWDSNKGALKVNVKAVPEKGKANSEIEKFFSKYFKKDVRVVNGLKSKLKTLKIS